MFSDAFAHDHQLLKTDPKHGLYLACGLIVRGSVEMSDIRRNIDRYVIAFVPTSQYRFTNITMLFFHNGLHSRTYDMLEAMQKLVFGEKMFYSNNVTWNVLATSCHIVVIWRVDIAGFVYFAPDTFSVIQAADQND